MPKNRPGKIFYATATKTCNHGDPVIESNIPGVAVKQQAPAATAAPSATKSIAIGERFAIISKGYVEVTTTQLSGATKGGQVWIDTTNNALAAASGANRVPFGRVYEIAGERGGATNRVRVDLDDKSTIPF